MEKRSALKDSLLGRSKRMVKQGIGFFMMTLGGMMGDSQDFILPIIIIGIGAWLMLSKGDNE